jgi:hypothetical protein
MNYFKNIEGVLGFWGERICLPDWDHHGAGLDAIHWHASHRFQRRHQRW